MIDDEVDAVQIVRGCGTRQKGGLYLECPLSPFGLPLELFLIDPPLVVDMAGMGVRPIGLATFERDGVWHVIDYVGERPYPNLADFVEEVRRFGLSRRVSSGFDFAKLTPESRIYLMHRRAYIGNAAVFRAKLYPLGIGQDGGLSCPKKKAEHRTGDYEPPMCAGLWWEDVEGGVQLDAERRGVIRVQPSFQYGARERPAGVEPCYEPAMFMWLPISQIAAIRDDDGGSHAAAMEKAGRAGVPVVVEDA